MNTPHIFSAPLQGFTDHIWRNAYSQIYGGIDYFFSSFIRIEHGDFRRKDIRDILPENNSGITLVPQLLACPADEAKRIALKIAELGYNAIDINLGCPFPIIARKQKGAGMLPYTDKVKQLFEALASVSDVKYSVKMRLGMNDAYEWQQILPLFNIINPSHVTIHPRLGVQQYKGELNMEAFERFYADCHYPLIFNGEIKSQTHIHNITAKYPNLSGVMIGRGLLENPAAICPDKTSVNHLRDFHRLLFDGNRNYLEGGDHQILAKMLTYWEYLLPDSPHSLRKKVLKSSNLNKYQSAVEELFNNI